MNRSAFAHSSAVGLLLVVKLALAPSAQAATWTPIGPSGGQVGGLVAAPSDPRVAYVTANGLYRSDDAGSTWIRAQERPFRVLAIAPDDARRVYLATPDGRLMWTEDGGATVHARDRGLPRPGFAGTVAFFPQRPSSLLATTADGVYRSDDAGASWRFVALAGRFLESIAVSPRNPRLWLGLEDTDGRPGHPAGTLLRSTNGGLTWSEQEVGYGPYPIAGPIFDPFEAGTVYLANAGVLVSRDNGATFAFVPGTPRADLLRLDAGSGTLYAASMSSNSPNALARSLDHGRTWTSTAGPSDQLAQLAPAGPNTVLSSGVRGVWKTDDAGRTWRASSTGIDLLTATSISASADGGTLYLGVRGEGVFRGDGTRAGWRHASRGLPRLPRSDYAEPHRVLADPLLAARVYDLTPRGLFVSDDRAAHWRRIALPAGLQLEGFGRLSIDPHDSRRLALSSFQAALLSEDAGRTWRRVLAGAVTAIVFDGEDRDRLYAAAQAGLQRSDDGGRTWRSIQSALPDFGVRPTAERLWTIPGERDVLYVSLGSYGFYGTRDGGTTFAELSEGPPGATWLVNDLDLDPAHPGELYLVVWTLEPGQGSVVQYRAAKFDRASHALRILADEPSRLTFELTPDRRADGVFFAAGESAFRVETNQHQLN